MRKHTITDAEALQLLSGATPEGRPELAELAASIADVRRDASQLTAPQPSVALAARLERPTLGGSVSDESVSTKGNTTMAPPRFGLAAKIAAAVGVLALGFMGVGAAGALPGPAQDAFDGVVSTIVPTEDDGTAGTDGSTDGSSEGTDGTDGALDECVVVDDGATDGATDGTTNGTAEDEAAEDELYGTTDDTTTDDTTVTDDGMTTDGTVDEGTDTAECEAPLPVGSGEFSDWVKQGARDPNKIGSEFGAAVSEQARELKNEKAEERAANDAENGAGSNGNGAGNGSGNGNGIGHGNTGAATHDDESSTDNGKPADTPGGRP
ncbi:MAG: hypothetical protein RL499_1530 [Actinomycetota bacterium]|jgi:hypothetical protein